MAMLQTRGEPRAMGARAILLSRPSSGAEALVRENHGKMVETGRAIGQNAYCVTPFCQGHTGPSMQPDRKELA